MATSSDLTSWTLVNGIQLMVSVLPLLDTSEWSEQITSALTRGYICSAAAPMSIYGGLGLIHAGLTTSFACFSFRGFEGATLLMKMGFEPKGENLSLIMFEVDGENEGHHVIESRMDKWIKELNIDKTRITGVSHMSDCWNVKMMATTALLCSFGTIPYLFLNLSPASLSVVIIPWVFPILRAIGNFLTTTLIQVLLRRRITTLFKKYLSKPGQRIKDVEAAGDMEMTVGDRIKDVEAAGTWLLLLILLMGIGASFVGYIGCYSVASNTPPLLWIFLETALLLIRSLICAYIPTSKSPPLKILLHLDENLSPHTYNNDYNDILKNKMLPLTRARDFLKIITSFGGLIEPFNNPDLSLYYTLTQKRTGEWILYITIFDLKWHTTRVYIRENEIDIFYSTKQDAPVTFSEVKIDVKIDPEKDIVGSDSNILDSLRKHHQSILEQIQNRLGATNVSELYAIENNWTMKVKDTIGTFQRSRKENGDDMEKFVEEPKEERTGESLASGFSMRSPETLLDEKPQKHGKLIARKNSSLTKETKERFQGDSEMEAEYRVNEKEVERKRTMSVIESIQE